MGVREGCRSGPRGDVEFGEDVLDVSSDRKLADAELIGDLTIGLAGRDAPEDFDFAPGEAMEIFCRPSVRRLEAADVRKGAKFLERTERATEFERRRVLVTQQ